ncbi:hypothetical protein M0657_005110 [Pyricularia oryzae]|nr:hypothetical protein M9X92_007828 [Pyricularia oryzae]KAI7923546.1 hypothetical protein M0657_005110 [Pyricularia oryzae]
MAPPSCQPRRSKRRRAQYNWPWASIGSTCQHAAFSATTSLTPGYVTVRLALQDATRACLCGRRQLGED